MSSTPFALVLSEEEIAALADEAVADLARRVARRAFRPLGGAHPAGASSGSPAAVASPVTPGDDDALAHLHALAHLQQALARQIDRTAARAARAGAGYPQLGQACNMTRQGARRRWPGLVPSGPVHAPVAPIGPAAARG